MLDRLKRSVAELVRTAVRGGTRDAQTTSYEVRPEGIRRDTLDCMSFL
jgi:hypothetical protein